MNTALGSPVSLVSFNPYWQHLVEYNQLKPVRVAEAIIDCFGQVRAAEGECFDEDLVASLQGVRLARPLELCISLAELKSSEDLRNDFAEVLRREPFYAALEEHKSFMPQLHEFIDQFQLFPLLQQKLTIMSARMGWLYWRNLGSAILCYLIADEMRLALQQKCELFWSAVAHDIGMLHLKPSVLAKDVSLNFEEWAHIQSHVDIGCSILRLMPAMPQAIIEAVSEHHERCDGTGYPNAKVESEISLAGQVLALADTVIAIYCNRYRDGGNGWQEVIPIIKLNEQEYLYRSELILTAIVERSELPLGRVVFGSKLRVFLTEFKARTERLHTWMETLSECLLGVGFTHGDRQLHALQNVLLHIVTSYRASAMFQPEFRAEVERLLAEDILDLPKEIGDACVMQQELSFHLLRLSRMLQQFMAKQKISDFDALLRLQKGVADIKDYVD